jgi:hypothetical protein
MDTYVYVSGMWLGVNLRTNTKRTCVHKRLDFVFKNMLTILGLIINMIGDT